MYRPVAADSFTGGRRRKVGNSARQRLILADSRLSVNVHVQMPKLQADPGFFEVLGARPASKLAVPGTAVSRSTQNGGAEYAQGRNCSEDNHGDPSLASAVCFRKICHRLSTRNPRCGSQA